MFNNKRFLLLLLLSLSNSIMLFNVSINSSCTHQFDVPSLAPRFNMHLAEKQNSHQTIATDWSQTEIGDDDDDYLDLFTI